MWAVVHFEKEKTVDAVPSKWLLKDTHECFWPPKNWGNHKISNSINNRDDPGVDWKVYKVKILGEYDNLKTAKKKVTKAMTTSDLSSHSESYVPLRKKARYHENIQPSSSSSGDETSGSSSNNNTFPTLPSRNIPLTPVVRVLTPEVKSTPLTNSTSTVQDTPRIRSDAGNNDAEFQRQVLRQLFIIKNMLVQQSESIDTLMKHRNEYTNEEDRSAEENNLQEITSMMPIQSLEDLEIIERILQDENQFKSFSKFLARIGGNTAKEIVRRIMYHTFSNTVGMAFSWEGAKKKKIFKNLKLAEAILKGVRLNERTKDYANDEVIGFIKAWLVRAKDRILQKEKSTKAAN